MLLGNQHLDETCNGSLEPLQITITLTEGAAFVIFFAIQVWDIASLGQGMEPIALDLRSRSQVPQQLFWKYVSNCNSYD